MLSLTARAARHVLDTAGRSGAVGLPLRVAAQITDSGDVRFGLGFDERREADEVLTFGELVVLVGSPSRALLADVELDVDEGADGEVRFVFNRPAGNASTAVADAADAPEDHP